MKYGCGIPLDFSDLPKGFLANKFEYFYIYIDPEIIWEGNYIYRDVTNPIHNKDNKVIHFFIRIFQNDHNSVSHAWQRCTFLMSLQLGQNLLAAGSLNFFSTPIASFFHSSNQSL
jgi:hypothetical protein